MKKFAHLFGYLLRRQLGWVVLFWALVAIFVALIHWESVSTILVGVIGLLALIIVIRVHDHLEEGALRVRPIEKNSLIVAELVFLSGAIVLPVMIGILAILISYEARAESYTTTLISLAFATSQLALWYVAGKLSKSAFGTMVLLISCYLPVTFLWAVVEYRNVHDTFGISVLFALGVIGFLSLSLIVLPLLHRTKITLFVGSAGVLLLAMSGVSWDRTEPGRFGPLSSRNEIPGKSPTPDESTSIKFAPSPLPGADFMKDSHWDYFQISTDQPDEIFIPSNVLGSPFTGSRSGNFTYYLWNQVGDVMLGDLILRNLPPGTDLRGIQPLSYNVRDLIREEPKTVRVTEEQKISVNGQKHYLVRLGQLPLKKGSSNKAAGYRVAINDLEFQATKLLVRVEIGWVFDSLLRTGIERGRTAWVLYSPSSKQGVLQPGYTISTRGNFEPTLIASQRESLEFPLPETFAGADDIELHAFYIEQGDLLKFEVTIPPGDYPPQ